MVILMFILIGFTFYVVWTLMTAGLILFILFALLFSYNIVYYGTITLGVFVGSMFISHIIYYILPTEQYIKFNATHSKTLFYSIFAMYLFLPLYDLYKFYTNKQGTTPLSTTTIQSAGSSHKKRK